MSYSNGQPMIAPQHGFRPPPAVSYRMKMALAATGTALFMAIATIALLKGTTGDAGPSGEVTDSPSVANPPPVEPSTTQSPAPARPPAGRTITPIVIPEPAPPPLPTTTSPSVTTSPPPVAHPPPPPSPPVAAKADRVALRRPDRKPEKPDRTDRTDRADKKVAVTKPEKASAADPAEVAPKKHGHAIQDVKHDAEAQYRRRDFNAAAAILSTAVPSFTGGDAQQLKSIATGYVQFGKAYNVGMAPATKATDAFVALRQALALDKDVGASFAGEIQERLVVIASRAAVSYMAAREYESAFLAVRTSDVLGSVSPSNKSVREKLQQIASDLYRTALNDLSTDPDSAKRKLHQILGMVDAKTQVYANASKLLNGS
jgi:hypothetical protein